MAHKTRTDYEVTEVEEDVWECDFCESEVADSDDIHVFAIEPKYVFRPSEADERLVWLNKDGGKRAVKQATSLETMMRGHICDECV